MKEPHSETEHELPNGTVFEFSERSDRYLLVTNCVPRLGLDPTNERSDTDCGTAHPTILHLEVTDANVSTQRKLQ